MARKVNVSGLLEVFLGAVDFTDTAQVPADTGTKGYLGFDSSNANKLTAKYGSTVWVIGSGGGGGAVDSVFTRMGAVVAAAGDYIASQITFTPDGDIAATNVQTAIVEVRDDADTKLAGKAASSHSHAHSATTGQGADDHHSQAHELGGADHNAATLAQLNAKISDATLDTSSASRTPTAHTHVEADISDLGTYQATSEKGGVSGYAGLDGSSKVPIAQLPTAAPAAVGTANAEGSSTSVARADHVHKGNMSAGRVVLQVWGFGS